MVLTLVLAESSIELVPNELAGHPAVLSWAHRRHRDPRRLILDQNYHHSAILKLGRSGLRRGRPDIAHFCLLLALGSPLSMGGRLRCTIHTRDNKLIKVNPRARLPRNSDRFVSLLEQLYEEKVVPPVGPPLLSLGAGAVSDVVREDDADFVVALTTQGELKTMTDVANSLASHKRPLLLVGGFPEGHFSKQTLQNANGVYRVDKRRMEAWTIVSRAIYDYERKTVPTNAVMETSLM